MNIDKFGHHVHKRLRLSEVFDISDKVFYKSIDGDLDLKSAKIKGLKIPQLPDEAVNKQYVDDMFRKYCEKKTFMLEINGIKSLIQTLKNQLLDITPESKKVTPQKTLK